MSDTPAEPFTAATRRAMACAEQEARTLRHRHIGTEHLLLGVLSVTEETGARALAALGVTLGDARAQVMRIVGLPEQPSPPQLPMTPQARDALGGALREAIELGDTTVGTGHVLLALLRERHGVAARLMHDAGIDRARLRQEVRTAGAQPTAPADPSGETDGGATPGDDRGVGAFALLGILSAGGPAADLLRRHGVDEAAARALLERGA